MGNFKENEKCKRLRKTYFRCQVTLYKRPLKTVFKKPPHNNVLHVSINDLEFYRPLDLTAKSIFNVTSSIKNDKHDATISNIISRADWLWTFVKALSGKRHPFNKPFKTFKTQHLNGSRLHLSRTGAPVLQNNLCKFLSKYFHWRFEESNVEIESDEANKATDEKNVNTNLRALHLRNLLKLINW